MDNCFKGAAMAIGCEAEIVNSQGYMPCPERLPEDILWDTAALLGDDVKVASIPAGLCNTASTDVGDLFAVMPGAQLHLRRQHRGPALERLQGIKALHRPHPSGEDDGASGLPAVKERRRGGEKDCGRVQSALHDGRV